MNVEIVKYPSIYEIKMGMASYYFRPSDYNALFHAVLQEPADDVVWVSCVTRDMVADPEDSGNLIDELDDFVADTVTQYRRGDN